MQRITDTQDATTPLPATEKQLHFAMLIASRNRVVLPREVQADRRALSQWIDYQQAVTPAYPLDTRPTSRQVAFAEKLATIKRRNVPDECFRDRSMLSHWIDSNR